MYVINNVIPRKNPLKITMKYIKQLFSVAFIYSVFIIQEKGICGLLLVLSEKIKHTKTM